MRSVANQYAAMYPVSNAMKLVSVSACASNGKVSWNSVGGGTMNRLNARSEIALSK